MSVAVGAQQRRFGVYIHVPYCRARCGYCDFNTYTPAELGAGSQVAAYPGLVAREIHLAQRVLAAAGLNNRPVSTVFFGGGTPTLLGASALAGMLAAVKQAWEVAPGAEISTEANPDSVTPADLEVLAAAGFTRVSFGVQSVVPQVLRTLERTHDPQRVAPIVAAAKSLGLEVSVDLIYGTPGESLADWRRSVTAALELEVNHVSAYSLVVEEGTRLAMQVRRGQVPAPDDDDLAGKYELADELFTTAGLQWYEVSNWAKPGRESRHNLGYWDGSDWWGFGPGAHSYCGSGVPGGAVRWWNVKHPRAYGQRVEAGSSPAAARELPTPDAQYLERVMLEIRLATGLAVTTLRPAGRAALPDLLTQGLIEVVALRPGQAAGSSNDSAAKGGGEQRIVLTRRGRLLADAVIRHLV